MNIVEWFDPHNLEHMLAWKHLNETGMWPEDFMPADMVVPINHQISIIIKLAECWATSILKDKD